MIPIIEAGYSNIQMHEYLNVRHGVGLLVELQATGAANLRPPLLGSLTIQLRFSKTLY